MVFEIRRLKTERLKEVKIVGNQGVLCLQNELSMASLSSMQLRHQWNTS